MIKSEYYQHQLLSDLIILMVLDYDQIDADADAGDDDDHDDDNHQGNLDY